METSYLVYALGKKYENESDICKNFRYKLGCIIGIFTPPNFSAFHKKADYLYVFEKIIPNTIPGNRDVMIYDPRLDLTAMGNVDMSDWLLPDYLLAVDNYNFRHLFDRIPELVVKKGLPL